MPFRIIRKTPLVFQLIFNLFVIKIFIEAKIVSLNPRYPIPPSTFQQRSNPSLWPYPVELHSSVQRYRISRLVQIKATATLAHCDIIQHNIDKYGAIIRQMIGNSEPEQNQMAEEKLLHEVYLFVDKLQCDSNTYPRFISNDSDDEQEESYSIEISSDGGKAVLYGGNIWGAIRALETFSQLLYRDYHVETIHGVNSTVGEVYVNVSRIWDRPRFPFRSIMLDTGRHFIPVPLIIKNLDAMAYNKFNTFHWHLSDDQSFPFESQTFSNLSRMASYSRSHTYTYKDISTVVDAARLRGIQVLVEIDTPGHCDALANVFPELTIQCKTPVRQTLLDPSKRETFQMLNSLFEEFRHLFKTDLIHLGMDDVSYECWSTNDTIREFMASRHFSTMTQLEEYYSRKLIGIVNKLGLSAITWQDVLDNGVNLPKDTIIQVWKDHSVLNDNRSWKSFAQKITGKGYRVILSACWFLNIIRYGPDWKDFYDCDPLQFDGSEEQKRLVIGGEACIWGEYVDGTNILSRLWPRASAVGERLWSESRPGFQSDADIQYRLHVHRCRLLRRGIPAQPTSTGYCDEFDWNHVIDNENRGQRIQVENNPIRKSDINESNWRTMFWNSILNWSTPAEQQQSVQISFNCTGCQYRLINHWGIMCLILVTYFLL